MFAIRKPIVTINRKAQSVSFGDTYPFGGARPGEGTNKATPCFADCVAQ